MSGKIHRGSAAWLLAMVTATAAAELPENVLRVVTALGVSPDEVSFIVHEIGSDTPLIEHLPTVSRNPASVMKLVTTWAALERLGPAYTWPTEIYFLGDFDGSTLHGDLGFRGYGDPFLVHEEIWKLMRALRRTGLSEIDGDIVLDDSYFAVDEPPAGAFDGQALRNYNVLPNALLLNFKVVDFQFRPEPAARRVRIASEPPLENLDIDNRIDLIDGACGGFQRGISFNVADPATADEVIFDGTFSRRCGVYSLSRSVLSHDEYNYGLLSLTWREVGGRLTGRYHKDDLSFQQRPALVWRSRPLGEIIRSVNKNSNNVMTRQLLYTLGAAAHGEPGTRANGVLAINEILATAGLDTQALNVVNGAGLSRDARVSPRMLVDLLRLAWEGPFAAEYIASLSIGGMDGTTRNRLDNSSGRGRVHVKSGSLSGVSALGGYLHSRSGRDYAFVVITNAEDANRGIGQEIEEAALAWIDSR